MTLVMKCAKVRVRAAASALPIDHPNSVIPTGAGANATAQWRDLLKIEMECPVEGQLAEC